MVLTRRPEVARQALPNAEVVHWDPAEPLPAEAMRDAEVVFHLAGESIAGGRWSDVRKRRIRDSRVFPTRNLVQALAKLTERPRVLVSASAVGYYGDRRDTFLPESAAPGEGFLSETCTAWENEAIAARALGMRTVPIRTGMVLGRDGGAFPKLSLPFRLGVGAVLGKGTQWLPWIHIEDLVSLYLHAAMTPSIEGVLNGVAPEEATQRVFSRTLAAVMKRPCFLTAPAWVLERVLGEMAVIVLASQRVVPEATIASGFEYRHPQLRPALADLVA